MTSLNRVYLAGNLTRDPELRYTPAGDPVVNMTVAISEVYTDRTGEKKENVVFVDVEAWGRQAETCGQYLSKGSPVLIEGRLRRDEWQTESGEKRSRLRVRADRVQFLGGPRRAEGAARPAAAGGPKAEPAPEPAEGEAPGGDEEDLPF